MGSFEKNKLKEQLAKDIKNYLEKGGVVNKLPVCPEVTKIKKEIDRNIVTWSNFNASRHF